MLLSASGQVGTVRQRHAAKGLVPLLAGLVAATGLQPLALWPLTLAALAVLVKRSWLSADGGAPSPAVDAAFFQVGGKRGSIPWTRTLQHLFPLSVGSDHTLAPRHLITMHTTIFHIVNR